MDTKDATILEQQRARRKRINRIKTTIVMSIAIWMLVSFLAIIILIVQVVKLNSRLYKLELQKTNIVEQQTDDSYYDNLGSSEATTEGVKYNDVVSGIDSEDNKAKEGDEHKVYLTFDSEPGSNTDAILDALDKAGVKATFFVSGDKNAGDIYKRIVDDGHTIGMHSYSNKYSDLYESKKTFKKDLQKIASLLEESTGTKTVYYRFPGGSGNEISNLNMAEFVNILNKEDIVYYDWNVSAGDTAGDYTVDDVVNNVVAGVSKYKTSVVLLHDDENRSTTAEAIVPLVKALKKMNADILPIDENTYVVQYIKADSVE